MRLSAALAALSFWAAPLFAQEPQFAWPVDCFETGQCYIQNLVDADPTSDTADFRCGTQAYDGHKGTDFALPNVAAIAEGHPVRTAAAGDVRATRDGMPDHARFEPGAPDITGRECGNGVVIDHEDGWSTMYCHLAEGSVSVARGDRVETGDVLGQIGASGAADFAHLHFSVRLNDMPVDPFDPAAEPTCGPSTRTLWLDPIEVPTTGIVAVGFSDRVPDYDAIKRDGAVDTPAHPTGEGLVFWGLAHGGLAGDEVSIAITGPEDFFVSQTFSLDRNRALYFRASGKRLRADRWPAGDYVAAFTIVRDGQQVASTQASITLP